MKLLQIDSSGHSHSVSRQLTSKFVDLWKQTNPNGEVLVRDLSITTLPQITDDWDGVFGDPSHLTLAQQRYLAVSDELIGELLAADTVVIGSPMHNLTISSSLKAWIDQVVRPSKTFQYEKTGPKGLLSGKKAVIITSRGGSYKLTTGRASLDFQEPYLRSVLGFIGLSDVTFIHAENQPRGEQAERSRSAAVEQIQAALSNGLSHSSPN